MKFSSDWNHAGLLESVAGRSDLREGIEMSDGNRLPLMKRFAGDQFVARGIAAPAVVGRPVARQRIRIF